MVSRKKMKMQLIDKSLDFRNAWGGYDMASGRGSLNITPRNKEDMSVNVSNVLKTYKNMLRLARNMPKDTKVNTVKQIREEFRRNRSEHDPAKVAAMLAKANSSLGYIKMVSPKRFEAREQEGVTKIAFGDAARTGRAVTNWTGKNMDPDSVKKHHQTLNRAGFKNNAHVKGPLF